jgi:DNA-directed RNA polymerase subunit M/transcription elongation factor TFIIS
MISIIAGGLIFSASAGLFFSFIIVSAFFPENGHKVVKTIFTIIFSLLIGFGIVGLCIHEGKIDTETYNEGVCIKCGGHYTIFDVEKDRHGNETYYYKCDNCGKVISTHCLFE